MSTYSARGERARPGTHWDGSKYSGVRTGIKCTKLSRPTEPARCWIFHLGSMYCERLVPPQAFAVHPYTIPDSSFCGATKSYSKIPKITPPGLLFFKGPFWGAYFWRGLYSEGLMYGGKFAFKNRLGLPYSWQEIYRFSLFFFLFEGNFQVQAPRGLYWFRGGI